MKPPNHGMRVRVTDPVLGMTFTGRLMLLRRDVAEVIGFTCLHNGLGLYSERSGLLTPVFCGDRIELLP